MNEPNVPYVDLGAQHPPGSELMASMLAAVERVLRHGQFILGPEVRQLEQTLEGYLGARHVIGVASGTDALVVALELAGIGPGQEVITTSHGFIATCHAIRKVGAEPVLVDIHPDTMLMDPSALSSVISERTSAVLPVHLNGSVCELDAIGQVCEANGLALVEDCAQALGARYQGRCVGSRGLGAYSLHPLKILGAAGDAGFVACALDEHRDRALRLRNLGLSSRDVCDEVAGNTRLDTIQAALLLAKWPYLEGWQHRRKEHEAFYRAELSHALRFAPPAIECDPVISCVAVRHSDRDRIIEHCRERGVDLKVHYPIAIHQQAPYRDARRGDLSVTERTVAELLSLPASPQLSERQRERVVRTILEVV